MKMKQLKALAALTVKKYKRTAPREMLQHVFVLRDKVYAANDYMVVEVTCKEINSERFEYANWNCLDLEACADYEKSYRYVDLNNEACYDVSDSATYICQKMGADFFSRFFDMKIENHSGIYAPELLETLCKVFKAFDIPIRFSYNELNNVVYYDGFDKNYSIRAVIMPLSR